MKKTAVNLPEYAMFSDDFRDCVKGSVFCDDVCGYVNGSAEKTAELMKSVMSAGIYRSDVMRDSKCCWTENPAQSVNYAEAHDNLTLYDKLRLSMPDASDGKLAADKLAAALVFLSQGIPFMQAGQELLRSKPAPNGGFVDDSYNSPDSINSIKWNDVTINRRIAEYYRGLIAIRKHFPEFRMHTAAEIRSRIKYEELGSGTLAVHYNTGTVLIVNPCETSIEYYAGSAQVYADNRRASAKPLYKTDGMITVKPLSITLIKR